MSAGSEKIVGLVALGDPPSKARPRFTGQGYKTRAYTPERTREAEEVLGWLIREARPGLHPDADHDFRVEVAFFTKTWQRRDLDNMAKLVLDACNQLVWADDSQVTELEISVCRGDAQPRTELAIYSLPPRRRGTHLCIECGNPVHPDYPSLVRTRRYCSDDCRGKGRARARIFRMQPESLPRPIGRPLGHPLDDLDIMKRREQDRERARNRRALKPKREVLRKLSAAQVREIRARWGNGEPTRALAAEYGVSQSYVSLIGSGKARPLQ